MNRRIKELVFSSLFIQDKKAFLKRVPEAKVDPFPVEPALAEDVENLRLACEQQSEEKGRNEFQLKYDDIDYRVSKVSSMNGVVYVLRRFPSTIPDLKTLGFPEGRLEQLLVDSNQKGLVLISGATSSGKTTTASALVKARLELHGGIAWTAEQPPEMPLEGPHAQGYCYQMEVTAEGGGFPQASKELVRLDPDIMFIGEIRDPEVAVEAIRAANTGHYVVSTIHAANIPGAIQRLMALSAGHPGSKESIASGLLGVVHQQLTGEAKQQAGSHADGETLRTKKLVAEYLMCAGNPAVVNHIKSDNLQLLQQEINSQTTLFQKEQNNRRAARMREGGAVV